MQLQLKVSTGAQAGKLISVNDDKFLVGRSDECQLRLKSDAISRRHCAIVRKNGNILLLDLKSRNGTILNGEPIDPSRAKVLKNGDLIQLGSLQFEVVLEPSLSKSKKPEVSNVKDAASRTVENASAEKFEEADVSSWLEEADQIERRDDVQSTLQFQINPPHLPNPDSTIMEMQSEQDTKTDLQPKKGKPGKLPTITKSTTANSKDAASETLRKFFSGR